MVRFVQGVLFGVILTASLALIGADATRSDRGGVGFVVLNAAESANVDTRTERAYDLANDAAATISAVVADDQDDVAWATPECGSP